MGRLISVEDRGGGGGLRPKSFFAALLDRCGLARDSEGRLAGGGPMAEGERGKVECKKAGAEKNFPTAGKGVVA